MFSKKYLIKKNSCTVLIPRSSLPPRAKGPHTDLSLSTPTIQLSIRHMFQETITTHIYVHLNINE